MRVTLQLCAAVALGAAVLFSTAEATFRKGAVTNTVMQNPTVGIADSSTSTFAVSWKIENSTTNSFADILVTRGGVAIVLLHLGPTNTSNQVAFAGVDVTTGTILWSYPYGEYINKPHYVFGEGNYEGVIYVTWGTNNPGNGVTAFNIQNGTKYWTAGLLGGSSQVPYWLNNGSAGGQLFGYDTNTLFSIDLETGVQTQTGAQNLASSPLLLTENVILTLYGSQFNQVAAYSYTGALLWTYAPSTQGGGLVQNMWNAVDEANSIIYWSYVVYSNYVVGLDVKSGSVKQSLTLWQNTQAGLFSFGSLLHQSSDALVVKIYVFVSNGLDAPLVNNITILPFTANGLGTPVPIGQYNGGYSRDSGDAFWQYADTPSGPVLFTFAQNCYLPGTNCYKRNGYEAPVTVTIIDAVTGKQLYTNETVAGLTVQSYFGSIKMRYTSTGIVAVGLDGTIYGINLPPPPRTPTPAVPSTPTPASGCAAHTDCTSCTKGTECGWCTTTSLCSPGSFLGPKSPARCPFKDWHWLHDFCPAK